jgi:tight adherence protein C
VKRRQRAEERASTVGVKLVFPLVLCLIPSLYVVCLGPVFVRVLRTLF